MKLAKIGLVLLLGALTIAQAVPSLSVIKAAGNVAPGSTFSINVVLSGSASQNQADVEWDFTTPNGVTISGATAGAAATAASKTLACFQNRCLISGINQNPLADGVLATFNVTLPATIAVGPVVTIANDANLVSATIAGARLATNVGGVPLAYAPCDLDGSGSVDGADVGLILAQALGQTACNNSLTGNGCTAVDVRRVEVAAQGGACVVGP